MHEVATAVRYNDNDCYAYFQYNYHFPHSSIAARKHASCPALEIVFTMSILLRLFFLTIMGSETRGRGAGGWLPLSVQVIVTESAITLAVVVSGMECESPSVLAL